MFCTKCGGEIDDGMLFCTECGTPVEEDAGETLGGKESDEANAAGSPDNDPNVTTPASTVAANAEGSGGAPAAPAGMAVMETMKPPAGAAPVAPSVHVVQSTIPNPNYAPMQSIPTLQTEATGAAGEAAGVKVPLPLIVALVVALVALTALAAFVIGMQASPKADEAKPVTTIVSPATSSNDSEPANANDANNGNQQAETTTPAPTTNNNQQQQQQQKSTPGVTYASGDYILPDSASRAYTRSELEKYDSDTLRLARNEIYARHGRKFKDASLQQYFNSKSWYHPTIEADNFTDDMLPELELKNARLMLSIEESRK